MNLLFIPQWLSLAYLLIPWSANNSPSMGRGGRDAEKILGR
jgi:hypothetical protein